MKEGNWQDIADPDDRAVARLANLARNDTIDGGCAAWVLAEKVRDGVGFHNWAYRNCIRVAGLEIVREVYSLSNRTCGQYGAVVCP